MGYSSELLIAIANRSLDYKEEDKGGAVFAKTKPNDRQKYDLLKGTGGKLESLCIIENEKFNIHDFQILSDKNILLVCASSYYRGPDDYEKNGRIYSNSGKFISEILLGDGIQNTQVTSTGVIWSSCFDEGVFGNFGRDEPVGSSGLVA